MRKDGSEAICWIFNSREVAIRSSTGSARLLYNAWSGCRPLAGKLDDIGWGYGLGFVAGAHQALRHNPFDVFELEDAALVHEADSGHTAHLDPALDPVIGGSRHAHDTRSVACHCGIDAQLSLKAQALELLGYRLPLFGRHRLVERPVCVYPAARMDEPRLPQRRQANRIGKAQDGLKPFFG